jgi:Uncharacterized protein conserved in bacteria (DUF2188)
MADPVYMVAFRWVTTTDILSHLPRVESALASNGNWARLNVHTWFVKSSRGAVAISARIRLELKGDDSVVVIRADPADAEGWAPKWLWEWLRAPESAKDNFGSPLPAISDGLHRYFVTTRGTGNQWFVLFNGVHYGPYANQAYAIAAAREAASSTFERGNGNAQVLIQGADNQWRTESSYGNVQFPPRG